MDTTETPERVQHSGMTVVAALSRATGMEELLPVVARAMGPASSHRGRRP
ncbi:hypothetical protein [Streptomyces sp. NBC_00829]|nr:hypothetical protein OG293_05070 [Streptomyces sp. NBC_00829]